MVEEILWTPILLADSFFRLPILDMLSEYSLLPRSSFSSSLFSLPPFHLRFLFFSWSLT